MPTEKITLQLNDSFSRTNNMKFQISSYSANIVKHPFQHLPKITNFNIKLQLFLLHYRFLISIGRTLNYHITLNMPKSPIEGVKTQSH